MTYATPWTIEESDLLLTQESWGKKFSIKKLLDSVVRSIIDIRDADQEEVPKKVSYVIVSDFNIDTEVKEEIIDYIKKHFRSTILNMSSWVEVEMEILVNKVKISYERNEFTNNPKITIKI